MQITGQLQPGDDQVQVIMTRSHPCERVASLANSQAVPLVLLPSLIHPFFDASPQAR
jgi:hypothetical protein